VRGIGIAIDEHNGGCFDPELFEPVAQVRQSGFIKRLQYFPVSADAFLYLKPERPFDQRFVFLEIQIVGVGPVDAADFIDVAKAIGGDQRSPGAGALQDRVDGNSGAMQKEIGRGIIAAGLGDTCADAVDQPIWR